MISLRIENPELAARRARQIKAKIAQCHSEGRHIYLPNHVRVAGGWPLYCLRCGYEPHGDSMDKLPIGFDPLERCIEGIGGPDPYKE